MGCYKGKKCIFFMTYLLSIAGCKKQCQFQSVIVTGSRDMHSVLNLCWHKVHFSNCSSSIGCILDTKVKFPKSANPWQPDINICILNIIPKQTLKTQKINMVKWLWNIPADLYICRNIWVLAQNNKISLLKCNAITQLMLRINSYHNCL